METHTSKYIGSITHFDPKRGYGFLSSRQADGQVLTFFFHVARVVFSQVEPSEIRVGHFARFISGGRPKSGGNTAAWEVEIFIEHPHTLEARSGVEQLAGKSEPKEQV